MPRPIFAACLFFGVLMTTGCQWEPAARPVPSGVGEVSIAGKVYPTLKIGDQFWTTANYSGPGGIPYRSDQEGDGLGRYYTLAEAKAVVLPEGWRVPTETDYEALARGQGVVFEGPWTVKPQRAVGRLASTTGWLNSPGTNASGFNALPGGYSPDGSDPIAGDIAEFWTQGGITFSIQEAAGAGVHRLSFYSVPPEGYRFNLRFVKTQ